MDKKGVFINISDGLFDFIKKHSTRVCPQGRYDNIITVSQTQLIKFIESRKPDLLENRNAIIELLESYSKYLEENGHMDTDWRTEEPYAIDEFLNKK